MNMAENLDAMPKCSGACGIYFGALWHQMPEHSSIRFSSTQASDAGTLWQLQNIWHLGDTIVLRQLTSECSGNWHRSAPATNARALRHQMPECSGIWCRSTKAFDAEALYHLMQEHSGISKIDATTSRVYLWLVYEIMADRCQMPESH